MQCIEAPKIWHGIRKQFPSSLQLGFVPTMGNLHTGHASLIEKSLAENDKTIVSIFINPTQFNASADYQKYPKTLDQDLQLLESLGVDYCFHPDIEAMYPDQYQYQVQIHSGANERDEAHMEALHRPGHFTGVLTVVMKLLQCIRPHNVYFGEKDYQQFSIIRDMVRAFLMDINIIACPTIREPSGLPFSSRNNRLSAEQRQKADIFAALFHDQSAISDEAIQQTLAKQGFRVDYIETHWQRRFAAVWIDDIRLIDNYAMV
ncbi:MAG: pantoate--beta-alanine ligase [Legionellaceae bacterium]|nr:pantoate--beta-alanine ligase [Legionellaceae bacterium]